MQPTMVCDGMVSSIYRHVLNTPGLGVKSPAAAMEVMAISRAFHLLHSTGHSRPLARVRARLV